MSEHCKEEQRPLVYYNFQVNCTLKQFSSIPCFVMSCFAFVFVRSFRKYVQAKLLCLPDGIFHDFSWTAKLASSAATLASIDSPFSLRGFSCSLEFFEGAPDLEILVPGHANPVVASVYASIARDRNLRPHCPSLECSRARYTGIYGATIGNWA
jgi:hypothetical protein